MTDPSTDDLNKVLENTTPDEISGYFSGYSESLSSGEHPFSDYMKEHIRNHGLSQQEVFKRADLSDRYSYRLINEEKHTRQRDYILRFCLAAEFSLKETQTALKLYGMSELYAKIPRDAVLIIAFHQEIYKIEQVNSLLAEHGMEPLKKNAAEK